MPTRPRLVLLACGALVICVSAPPLLAEPITVIVTSGTASFSPNTGTGVGVPFQLYGTDGFSFTAFPGSGIGAPHCCVAPGATVSYSGAWSSSDLNGTVTYNGDVFTNVGSINSVNTARLAFMSSPFTLSPPEGATSTTVTAPFTLTGYFVGTPGSGPEIGPPSVSLTLVGSGVGTLLFTLVPGGPFTAWDPKLVSLQIGATDAVPEPSSILLVCLGLAGVYTATRYRREQRMRVATIRPAVPR